MGPGLLGVGLALVQVRAIGMRLMAGREVAWAPQIVGFFIALPILVVLTLGYHGLCHGLAKAPFHADSKYIRLIRPMMLASVVTWLSVVPVLGQLGAGL